MLSLEGRVAPLGSGEGGEHLLQEEEQRCPGQGCRPWEVGWDTARAPRVEGGPGVGLEEPHASAWQRGRGPCQRQEWGLIKSERVSQKENIHTVPESKTNTVTITASLSGFNQTERKSRRTGKAGIARSQRDARELWEITALPGASAAQLGGDHQVAL